MENVLTPVGYLLVLGLGLDEPSRTWVLEGLLHVTGYVDKLVCLC